MLVTRLVLDASYTTGLFPHFPLFIEGNDASYASCSLYRGKMMLVTSLVLFKEGK